MYHELYENEGISKAKLSHYLGGNARIGKTTLYLVLDENAGIDTTKVCYIHVYAGIGKSMLCYVLYGNVGISKTMFYYVLYVNAGMGKTKLYQNIKYSVVMQK